MDTHLIKIRKANTPSDWKTIRNICCETGNNGSPINSTRWEFFGEQWIGPYQLLLPEWTWVAEASGQIVGYITGCPHSSEFEREKMLRFVPKTLISIALGKYGFNSDVKRFLKRTTHLSKGPEQCFSPEVTQRLKQDFPAHLHINLSESSRGTGIGKVLCHHFFSSLTEQKIPGVHVFCGPSPLGFYEQIGFREMGQIEFRPGIKVYAMGLSLI